MSEKPIIFSGEMVNAILAGNKTQTRRVVKSALVAQFDTGRGPEDAAAGYPFIQDEYGDNISAVKLCPYGAPGDKLWVRETWKPTLEGDKVAYYRAGFDPAIADAVGWKPSIFMPRWASRITLEVLSVRVERVQDISEEDAKAEGIRGHTSNLGSKRSNPKWLYPAFPDKDGGFLTAKQAFEALWDSINAKRGYSWEGNPWVFVVEFKRVTQ